MRDYLPPHDDGHAPQLLLMDAAARPTNRTRRCASWSRPSTSGGTAYLPTMTSYAGRYSPVGCYNRKTCGVAIASPQDLHLRLVLMSIETSIASLVEDQTGQPYPYRQVELVEPDWTRFPGWRDVTAAEWASVQWQRSHCVKNVKQLRELLGDLVDERFYADLERDQSERATMSMLVPPQMMNTMVPHETPAGPGSLTEAFYADPVRHYMIPVFSDRRTDWPSHPHATRDSLHEHDMWVAEGLTHRYPTKVLAELLPTCPQYCGHCTRMDLVGNSTPTIDKLKFVGKPVDRLGSMLDYLRRTPTVRDVVVSGGDVANMPWPRLEDFLTRLLEIENIRDIRLATKALVGLPQHWLQDDVRAGVERVATRRPLARGLAGDPHPRQPRQLDHAAGRPGVAGDARRRRPRRAQPGRAAQRRQRRPARAARPVLPAARWRADHAVLLLHVRPDPLLGALAGLGRRRAAAAAPHHGLPAGLRDAADRLRRAVRRQALGAPGRRLRHRARRLVLDQELPDLDRGHRRPTRSPGPTSTTTRSTPCPEAGRALVGRSTATSTRPTSGPPRWPRHRGVRRRSRPGEPGDGRRSAMARHGAMRWCRQSGQLAEDSGRCADYSKCRPSRSGHLETGVSSCVPRRSQLGCAAGSSFDSRAGRWVAERRPRHGIDRPDDPGRAPDHDGRRSGPAARRGPGPVARPGARPTRKSPAWTRSSERAEAVVAKERGFAGAADDAGSRPSRPSAMPRRPSATRPPSSPRPARADEAAAAANEAAEEARAQAEQIAASAQRDAASAQAAVSRVEEVRTTTARAAAHMAHTKSDSKARGSCRI